MRQALLALPLLAACVPAPPAGAECVVLVHGLGRTSWSMVNLAHALSEDGYRVVNETYDSTSASIQQLAEETLPRALAACGSDAPHVVTHSMGAILLRQYMWAHPGTPFGRVVMLAPPNRGSELVDTILARDLDFARWIVGPAGLQLGTGAASLPNALPPATGEVGIIAGRLTSNPVYSALIPGPDDGKVSVDATWLDGAADHITLPVTHTFLIANPAVIEQVIAFLRDGQFDRSPHVPVATEIRVAP